MSVIPVSPLWEQLFSVIMIVFYCYDKSPTKTDFRRKGFIEFTFQLSFHREEKTEQELKIPGS